MTGKGQVPDEQPAPAAPCGPRPPTAVASAAPKGPAPSRTPVLRGLANRPLSGGTRAQAPSRQRESGCRASVRLEGALLQFIVVFILIELMSRDWNCGEEKYLPQGGT